LVAAGAALWGTESVWRRPLGDLFDADVIVWWEHVILVALALPFIVPRLGELRRVRWQAIASLLFSGFAGSAVGTIFFQLAVDHGNATVVGVVLNVQPVLSTTFAVMLFRDRLARMFPVWAALAVLSGMVLVGLAPGIPIKLDPGVGYALVCALFWGIATVAGRGVMTEMSVPLASGLRVVIGLATMTIILAVQGKLGGDMLWPEAAAAVQAKAVTWLLGLAVLSGGIPLLFYFWGLSLTRASTAGYFEMMQTLANAAVAWGFLGDALLWWQVIAALVLIGAVAMVQRAQAPPPDASALPDARVVS
jgi:drug/metabolite transporter (DMT)-like permease